MFTTAPASFTQTLVATFATAVFAGACLFGAAAPAAAAQADLRVIEVSYGQYDLTHGAGRAALDTRIVQAARSICYSGSRELAARTAYKACVKVAVADARSQVYTITASADAN